jgi:hypothetical protein
LAALLVSLACVHAVPSVAGAVELVVNSTGDAADPALGVGCLTREELDEGKAAEECTLRAALERSNGSAGEADAIAFDEGVFEGQAGDQIALGSSLPAVTDSVFVNGRQCQTAADVAGPCVGVDGPGSAPALVIDETEGVELTGLAITGASIGIEVVASPGFKVQASWIGVELDGSAGGNGTGILLGPGSDNGRIGGEGPEARNVLAHSAADALDIHGAANARVLGNYFGIEPDGSTPAANGDKDIEVASTGGLEAVGTTIGTKIRASGVTTPQCDFGCNVISGAGSHGIDLMGDGGAEAPAVASTVAGNYLGLNATGSAAVANAVTGIRVGKAAQTVIGGTKAGEANRINGGGVGILAGPGAADLVIQGNRIGFDETGAGSLVPPGEGIVVNSTGLSGVAVEAAIVDNAITMEGGIGIAQQGFGARIADNEILSADTGIRVFASTAKHGNLIEGNAVAAATSSGILIENDLNDVLANEVSGSGGNGIWVKASGSVGVKENLIGGDEDEDENVIEGSGGNAIEIFNREKTDNEVARNRGAANSGLFLDLVASAPETDAKDPNRGIQPPQISNAGGSSAGGGGALPGATIRLFRKQLPAAGEIASFLGMAIADETGNWEVVYGSAVPNGTIVAATQTSAAGGTSELATATTVGGASGTSGGGGDAADATQASAGLAAAGTSFFGRFWPRTKILGGPKRRSRIRRARFEFESDEAGSRFLCRLDSRPFDLCRSPRRYRRLEPGRHLFEVRAIDPDGHLDPTPAKARFTVLD